MVVFSEFIIFSSITLITNINCGSRHTALVTCKFFFIAVLLFGIKFFLKKSSSCSHCFLNQIQVDGLLYCFGDNTVYQLGMKNTVDGPAKCCKPERIKLPPGVRIKTVSCGAYHSAAVSGMFIECVWISFGILRLINIFLFFLSENTK